MTYSSYHAIESETDTCEIYGIREADDTVICMEINYQLERHIKQLKVHLHLFVPLKKTSSVSEAVNATAFHQQGIHLTVQTVLFLGSSVMPLNFLNKNGANLASKKKKKR